MAVGGLQVELYTQWEPPLDKTKWVGFYETLRALSLEGCSMDKCIIRGNLVKVKDVEEFREKEATLPCVLCGKLPTPEGYDACLGELPGVLYACCGHGDPEQAYVYFENGITMHGIFRIDKVDEYGLERSKRIRKLINGR